MKAISRCTNQNRFGLLGSLLLYVRRHVTYSAAEMIWNFNCPYHKNGCECIILKITKRQNKRQKQVYVNGIFNRMYNIKCLTLKWNSSFVRALTYMFAFSLSQKNKINGTIAIVSSLSISLSFTHFGCVYPLFFFCLCTVCNFALGIIGPVFLCFK